MAEWKKVVVSGSNISELNNDSGFITSVGSGIVSGSSQISFTGITGVPSGLVSSSAQTVANLPAGTISGSSQVDYTGITNVPSGLVSGSAQISVGGDLSGTANSATVTKVQGVALTSDEATQIANIGTATISATQWGYLGGQDQSVAIGSNVSFGALTTDGAVLLKGTSQNVTYDVDTHLFSMPTASVGNNLTVGGDLIVQGDLTYLNTTNTLVEDQFILLGSGSTSGTDIGIIFDGIKGTTGQGAALFYDGGAGRLSWKQSGVSHTATSVTPDGYIPLAFDVTGAGQTAAEAVGNIKIESGEAFIYV